jgi:para-nitrobenzyl esterase
MRLPHRLLAAVLGTTAIAGALLVSAGPAGASSGSDGGHTRPVVGTAEGPVRGVTAGSTAQFLGIPYAAPPVGPLRWQPPQPAARHHGVLDAGAFGPHCPQNPSPYGSATNTSENCLSLNVFAPQQRDPHRPLPVMVWIHGGALVSGGSEGYDPTPLVDQGVIVVTINYRLGALGFLADSSLEQNGSSGDYGLMDQQAALRWVQRNVGSFGGDRRNVTIFGESAGGLSVLSQVASPQAAGLFAKAIVESGGYNLTQLPQAAAEQSGAAFAAAAGCPDNSAACLRALSVDQVLAHQNGGLGYQPNVSAAVLPQPISTALTTGTFNRVPIVNGTNADEWRLFVQSAPVAASSDPATYEQNYENAIAATFRLTGPTAAAAKLIAAQYPLSAYGGDANIALGAAGTDGIFACGAVTVDTAASRFVPTYAYEFADENAPQRFLPPTVFPYGAYHASELQYLFTLVGTPFPGTLTAAQQALAGQMQRYWTDFAKTGTPNAPARVVDWPAWNSATGSHELLVPPVPHPATGLAAQHKCAFWVGLGFVPGA